MPSTHRKGWSTSTTESAEPKAAASVHLSEMQVQKRWSTVHSTHRKGTIDVCNKTFRTESCGKRSSFGVTGTKIGKYCAEHAQSRMVNVRNIKCRTEGCGKRPSFGVAGTKTGENCAQHALEGMIDVRNRKCRTEGCGKRSSFGVAGTKTEEYCAQHAVEGMVNVQNRK